MTTETIEEITSDPEIGKAKKINPFRLRTPRKRFFARWARTGKPFTAEKHTAENGAIVYRVVRGVEYSNHIETAGLFVSAIISYGAKKDGTLRLFRHVTYPTLRTYPNETSNNFNVNFEGSRICVNGKSRKETAVKFVFDGKLIVASEAKDLKIERTFYPSSTEKAFYERVTVEYTGTSPALVLVEPFDRDRKTLRTFGAHNERFKVFSTVDHAFCDMKTGQRFTATVAYCATNEDESLTPDGDAALTDRNVFLDELDAAMGIETPDPTLNLMTRYAKIRASESIFQTKRGFMHSPGGGGYYAALWTNDQCEYVNPLFGYLGYEKALKAASNCFKLYKELTVAGKPLVSSIISEGDGIWNGAGDRGDGEMFANGAARYLLETGNEAEAKELLPAILTCLDYALSQKTADGVIASDSDELENRFESGSANLSVSCITADALESAAYLLKELGEAEKSSYYRAEAEKLRQQIDAYFGADVEGFQTYRYCKEEKNLRSWIAYPLCIGIFSRAEATKDALLSDRLRMRDGLVTRSGDKTFWDRSTLYALRGLFYAGFADKAAELLKTYSSARLLGEHIPYAVEAFPEGNQAQLSAESGLYLRVYTEGILGFRPAGFLKFTLYPHLPSAWDRFAVKRMKLGDKTISISVARESGATIVSVSANGAETAAAFTGLPLCFDCSSDRPNVIDTP